MFTGNVPMGLGVKYKAAERLNVGLEWAVHFSLSDELDGYKELSLASREASDTKPEGRRGDA